MKLIRLTMTALGPYKDSETIDFTELEDRKLFVISGATGAGKTTIFDAITYALYGTASGADRENVTMLRSHFANDDVHTSVELIFKLHESTYRIFRQMGHVKEGNKTKTGESYEFFEIKEAGEVPVVDRQIVTEINDKVQSLIGLTVEQFKQIVMLPQGEFRELLTSNTENKEEILRRIFQTERYQIMNELLRKKHEILEQQFVNKEKELERSIDSIKSTLAWRKESELFTLLEKEQFQVQSILEYLGTEIEFYKERINKDEKLYNNSINAYEQQQKRTAYAEMINKKFNQRDEKQTELSQLLNRADEMKEKERMLRAAERANSIEPYELQLKERKQENKSTEATMKNNAQQLQLAKKSVKEAQVAFDKEEDRNEEREQLTEKLLVYEKYVPIVEAMNKRKAQIDRTEKQLQAMHDEITAISNKIKINEEKINDKKATIKKLEKNTAGLADHQVKRHQLRNDFSLWNNIVEHIELHNNVKKEFTEAKRLFDEEAKQLSLIERQWVEQQAAVLAQSLADGEACPVCGSTHHPNKQHSQGEFISDEQLEVKKSTVQRLQTNFHESQSKVTSALGLIEQTKKQLGIDSITLGEARERRHIIKEEGLKLKELITNLEQQQALLLETREKVEQNAHTYEKLQKQKEALEKTYSEKQIIQATAIATFKESIREIPEPYQQIEILRKNIAKTKDLKEKLENNWKVASEQLKQAETALTTGQVQFENSKTQLEKTQGNVKKAAELFECHVKKAQFTKVEQYIDAKMATEVQEKLQLEIEQYKQLIVTLQKQLVDLEAELKKEQRVNVDEMKQQLVQLKERYERALEQMNESKQYKEKAKELHKHIYSLHNIVTKLEKEVINVRDVYDVLRGRNSRRISFERYLQIDYLDHIIYAANNRFKTLSDGQYHLVRSERQESHGRQSGLTIDVYDAYTGQMRDVKTLSGGEKFIASLCLALGMSDVIQSYQGSIRIDTMFIDEGFGSLDDESLHKSIDALIQLQKTGRIIGVISHVNELKQMFPARLEVTKTKEGHSSASFVLR